MSKRTAQFQTIRTEGAILPPDILRSIAALAVDGVSADSYHLPPSTKLNEAISQAWTALLAHWKAFQAVREKMPAHDETGTAVTNERWLLPLFKELDYGRLTTSKSPEIDGRHYPVERFYQHTPIHLIGCNLPLDRRTRGARGAATASPHSMMQEYLNRADNSLWGFLSNGMSLRILRDNVSLSRQAYVEFDLEAMFDGEVYSDFALLWMLCHQSRVEAEKAQDCWLEKWSKLARDRGTRVLDDLRVGVTSAIEALGRGFIAHPKNDRLRGKLRTGALTTQDYYRQLLRIVYRLLFLFVAEDRGLLHPPDAGEDACQLYDEYYSTARLRELCRSIRGSKHGDLWHTLSLVFDSLGSSRGLPQLGLPALGSFLWRRSSTADLVGPAAKSAPAVDEPVHITNDDLLSAVRALAYVQQDKVLRDVDYRNLGSEELGSVYESLLELHPEMNIEGRSFSLSVAAGHERKTTGSYYTPDSLVQCLLDSALEPVVAERIKGLKANEAEKAILNLKVCDPACGSGHFLIAAAHRLARHLARIRTGESEPSPEDHQHALRDIIGRCIYGVDLNPMAVELCQVSLWIEAIEPGKPLSFLDHHIQCGNSLLGTTPTLLAKGIPDDAFTPIEGDEKTVCTELKKDNKRERKDYERGYRDFHFAYELGNLPAEFARLTASADDSLADAETKERRYTELVKGAKYKNARLLADAWCSVFVWRKDKTDLGKLCPTERTFRNLQSSPDSLLPHVRAEVERLLTQYKFFHWHLSFPDVFRLPAVGDAQANMKCGWIGGFDAFVGNPPWEKINFRDEEYFANTHPDIANASNKSVRKQLIENLRDSEPLVFAEYYDEYAKHLGMSAFFRASGAFPLTGISRINLYSIFAELACQNVACAGRVGLVIASGIATDDNNKLLFAELVKDNRLVCIWDFENREGIFPAVHRSYKFCIFCAEGGSASERHADFAFYLGSTSDLSDADRHFTLSFSDLERINPTTNTAPVFRHKRDATIVKSIYSSHATPSQAALAGRFGTPKTPFNSANDSGMFLSEQDLVERACELDSFSCAELDGELLLPIYESKLIHQFNHRYATFSGVTDRERSNGNAREVTSLELGDPACGIGPRHWLEQSKLAERFPGRWFFAYRDVTGAVNERTSLAAILPQRPCIHSLILIDGLDAIDAATLAAAMNSFVYDYLARQKIAGNHFNQTIWKQLPLVDFEVIAQWWQRCEAVDMNARFIQRVLELSYTAWDLESFARSCNYHGPPFRWDDTRRFHLRCELDASFFHLYGIQRDEVDYIMDTFPIVRRKDESKYHGEYKTKATILEMYDQMANALHTGHPYATWLDPPPADPRVAHPSRAQQLAYGDVVADILLLLNEWNSAVSILALEPAVLLMQNEQARNAFLGRGKTSATTDQGQPAYKIVEGIDLVYQGLVVNGAIEPVGQNGYRLLKPELIADLSAENRQRARQVVAAIQKLDRPEDALAIVAEVTHDRYAVAVS